MLNDRVFFFNYFELKNLNNAVNVGIVALQQCLKTIRIKKHKLATRLTR